MSVWAGITGLLLGLVYLFRSWLYLFISPVFNFEMLWIILPIWITWIFAELFQEKDKTSFGSAISNGVMPIIAAMDFSRYLIEHPSRSGYIIVGVQYIICLLLFIYGILIIYFGIRHVKLVHKVGKIREVTYIMLVFAPVIYGVVPLSWRYVLSIVLFFPIFYYGVELIDRLTPRPEALKEDEDAELAGRVD